MTLHAPQILGFFRKPGRPAAGHADPEAALQAKSLANNVVVATDAGAGKIAGHFAKRLGCPWR